jgi:hypothetical protein
MAFDYLTVLISLIIGLVLANVLTGLGNLIHERERVRLFFPSVVWAVWIFVAAVQHWWADYSLHRIIHWSIAGFFSTLLIPVDLYLLSELVLPRRYPPDSPIHLDSWYFRNRKWFFGIAACLPVFSFVEQLLVTGDLKRSPLDSAFLAVLFVLALIAFATPRRRIHAGIAVVTGVLLCIYIAVLFAWLRT